MDNTGENMTIQNQSKRTMTTFIAITLVIIVFGSMAHMATEPEFQAQMTQVFVAPFFDPPALKTMTALSILIMWFGGIGIKFLAEFRTTVLHVCGAMLVGTYALGLTIAHFF